MERIELGNDIEVTIPGQPGVVVWMRRGAGLRDYLLFRQLGELDGLTDESVDAFEDGVRKFGNAMIVDWNVNLRGEPLEANGEGLLKLPASFQLGLLQAWIRKMQGGVDAPLDDDSLSGDQSREEQEVATAV